MAGQVGWSNSIGVRAPAAVWYAPETLLWLAVLLALPGLVALVVNPLLRGLLARVAARRGEAADAACLVHHGFRWALLSMLAGAFVTWEAWYVLGQTDPGWPWRSTAIVNPQPGLWAAAYLALALGVCLGMAGYVTALNCSANSRSYRDVPAAVRQAWLGGAAMACFTLSFAVLFMRPLLALPPLAAAVTIFTVMVRRGLPLAERAREVVRQEQAAEAVALAGLAPTRGEYRGETIWRPLRRTGVLFLAAMGVLFAVACATIGPGAAQELLRLYPPLVGAVACGACMVVLVVYLAYGSQARQVIWDEERLEVTYATARRRGFRWCDLTALSVSRGAARVAAGRNHWTLSQRGDGFTDLVTALKARVWGRKANGDQEGPRRPPRRDLHDEEGIDI